MAYENLLIEKNDGIGLITINRPKALNALNSATLNELDAALDELRDDASVRVLVITGAGRAFVAGADISEMKDMDEAQARQYGELGQKVFTRIERLKKPVIAAVNGFALGGGCELAMSCDIRLASAGALFGQPEVNLGVIPGFGGTQRLPRLVGAAKAKELIMTGDHVKADEAHRLGLVNAVIDDWKRDDAGEKLKNEKGKPIRDEEKLLGVAMEMARKIASKGPLAIQWSKDAVNRGVEVTLDNAMVIEAEHFSRCFTTADQKEGMTAFLEKRPANFKGE